MKVMHIGNLKSGIDTYVRNTVALASDGFEYVIVKGADDKSEPYMRHQHEIKTYTIPMYRALNLAKDFMAINEAIKIIRREKPDLVHCHSAKGGVVGRIAAFLTGTKSVYTAHAFSFLSAKSFMKQFVFLLLEKITRLNSVLLGCSESERELGVSRVGYKPMKAFVWSNAIPDPGCGNIELPKEDFGRYVSTIGRPSYQKNPLMMVEVARKVHERYRDVKFLVLGVGFYSPMLEEMQNKIREYGLEDVFILKDWMSHEDTLAYVKRSMIYIMTSLYEGLPISVLEAMALGKALVLTDVLGNRDCVDQGKNGFLVRAEDVDDFVDKICRLLEKNELREELGKESRRLFEKRFLINERIGELERLYRLVGDD